MSKNPDIINKLKKEIQSALKEMKRKIINKKAVKKYEGWA